ncbi:hypothetical protein B7R54_12510 [Subtercola boreus]|uniref:Uncharacterized protein n=1 Tax=Subtercola boreus TaxID=120213 RepID=A0A3E0VIZ6_9MICO|nr:hypothetical protein B7R54_12510 [Subtercola boreus]
MRPGATTADLAISLWCDDGKTYPLHTALDSARSNLPTGVSYSADLPLTLVGHGCTLAALDRTGQPVWFRPARYSNSKAKTTTILYGDVVYRNGNGGL